MAQNTRKLVGVILMLAMLVAAIAALTVTASAADEETIKYTVSSYPAGTQYKAETHKLDDYMTVITNTRCHFTSELRIYAPNGGVNGEVVLASTREMTKVVLNAGNKSSTLTVYTSSDNSTWSQHSTLTVASSYQDLTISNLPVGTMYVKLVNGSGQVRVKYITVTYAAANEGTACEHANVTTTTVDATCTEAGSTKVVCDDCGSLVSNNTIPALGHTGGEPTCEDKAICDTCGEEYGNLLAHDFVDGVCTACGLEQPTEATIDFSTTDHRVSLDTSSQVWTNGGLTVTNNKGSSSTDIANYSKPVRFYKDSTIEIAFPGMTEIVVTCNTAAYATALKDSVTGATVSVSDKVVTITPTQACDTFTIKLTGGQVRVDSISASAPAAGECVHEWDEGVVTTAPTCTTLGVMTYTCTLCDETKTASIDKIAHTYVNDWCSCGYPKPGMTLTIPQASELGLSLGGDYTADKYYMVVTVVDIYDTSWGNANVVDKDGNKFVVYGLYSADGKTRYDAMTDKPVAGDIITVYGIIGSYNNAPQMKNGWVTDIHRHVYFYPCDAHCMICGELTNEDASHTITHVDAVEATCQSMGNVEYWVCNDCGSAWTDEALTQQTNRMSIVTFKDHEYFYPCDAHCMLCGELTNEDAAHTLTHVDAVEATCNQNGNVEYWTCTECGYAWLDEACTMVANRFTVIVPALAAVAQIGDVKYATLQDAFNAAVDGDTIVLLDDVAVDKYVDVAYQKQEGDTYDEIVARVLTLDLNGKTISTGEGYKFSNFGVVYVGLKQTLTITNGTITCNVKEEVTVGGYGVINLENCTLINEAGAPAFCIYQSKPGDQYNGDAYGEGTYTGTGSIGAGVVFDGEIEINGNLAVGEEKLYVAFKGAGVRYAKGNGDLEDPAKVSIRFGYEFSDISLVKAWGWSYSANGKTLTKEGKYAADNVTNLVLTNIPTEFLGAEITVELWYTVEINGVDVTIYDGGNARVTAEVLANTVANDSNANAVAYAKAALYLAGNEEYKAEYDAWLGKEN